MNSSFYLHDPSSCLEYELNDNNFVRLGNCPEEVHLDPFELALHTWSLAKRIGIKQYQPKLDDFLPYEDNHDNLVYDAPICSKSTNAKVRLLRGWNKFDSCIKGFNGLGLIAEHWVQFYKRLSDLEPENQAQEKVSFLKAKKTFDSNKGNYVNVFSDADVSRLTGNDLEHICLKDVALWKCITAGPIICSTSSNMGISIHQALRYLQRLEISLGDKIFCLLNHDEGSLVIWCPDEEADFMNSEKTETLRALANELPHLTVLHTYINRKERDPGALKDALETGGYFFPTNPQSKEEMQSFLIKSIDDLSKERNVAHQELLSDSNVRQALDALRCEIGKDNVVVRVGVEGGLNGLMLGYLLMLEESVSDSPISLSTWNQASIGAALAAAVMADRICHNPDLITQEAGALLAQNFPNIEKAINEKQFGIGINTRIHGVFDIANLQSLAQLLGVVVERHVSGRGIPYVGLGSSSYANGNRCYEILMESADNAESFRGKESFHPTTHTLNPVAQAMIFADDWHRCAQSAKFDAITNEIEKAKFLLNHTRKPEPAGAAALSGYILARLDADTLSLAEIAYPLQLVGFDSELFLSFTGTSVEHGDQEFNWFLQESAEEGKYMKQLANQFLALLDLPLDHMKNYNCKEKELSLQAYRSKPLDNLDFEEMIPFTNIYLTGDNTTQPDIDFALALFQRYEKNKNSLIAFLNN